jgi:tRNA(Arg) A34 adenosine deaminase TadA
MSTFTKQDEMFMHLALEKARQGTLRGQTPFGACIVRRASVVSLAHNRVWRTTDITAHAEVDAIRLACRKLKTISLADCVIYSTCEPCPMCFSACHWAGIGRIYFGASIRDAKNAGFNELCISSRQMKSSGKSRVQVLGGLLRKENVQLLRTWALGKNKKTY